MQTLTDWRRSYVVLLGATLVTVAFADFFFYGQMIGWTVAALQGGGRAGQVSRHRVLPRARHDVARAARVDPAEDQPIKGLPDRAAEVSAELHQLLAEEQSDWRAWTLRRARAARAVERQAQYAQRARKQVAIVQTA